MFKHKTPLLFSFILAALATSYASVFFPHFHLHTFAPFLALLYCRCSKMSSIWIGSLCGLFFDLFSSEIKFGIYALSFGATSYILYPQKKRFYSDKPLALCLFSFLISVSITLFLFVFSRSSTFSFMYSIKWFVSDFVMMPFFDALYAFLWFSLPIYFYSYCKKMSVRSHLSKVHSFFKRKKCSE